MDHELRVYKLYQYIDCLNILNILTHLQYMSYQEKLWKRSVLKTSGRVWPGGRVYYTIDGPGKDSFPFFLVSASLSCFRFSYTVLLWEFDSIVYVTTEYKLPRPFKK